MRLTFRGPPILSSSKGAIRFTGYQSASPAPTVVICHVTRDALEYLSRNPEINAAGMLSSFNEHRSVIRGAACAPFESGQTEPVITAEVLKGRGY